MADPPEPIIEPSSKINLLKTQHRFVEIPVFAYFFAFALSESVLSNLILYNVCISHKYNTTLCTLLVSSRIDNTTKHIEDELQPQASMIIMCKSVIEGIFPGIISLLLGPWSDLNGRKPLVFSTLIGYIFYFVLIMGYIILDNLNPWYLLLASIPHSLSGATASIITGSFCYISDITTTSNRSLRMGLLEGAILTGSLFGALFSSYTYKAFDYTGVFGISIIICLFGILSTASLTESLSRSENSDQEKELLNKKLVIDMIKVCFKKRTHYKRMMIWLILLACASSIFVMQGDISVSYLFTREKLDWKLENYTIYSAFSIVLTIFGILIIATMQKYSDINDTIISMISYLSAVVQSIIVVLANKTWHMYLGSGISCLRAVSGPINRSILTKIVPSEDAGKILSLTTSFEAIIPLLSSPIYSSIYQNTLSTFPGSYNILTACVYSLSFLLITVVHILLRHYPADNYQNLTNE